ncbi:mCG128912, partial [Mus musculus]
ARGSGEAFSCGLSLTQQLSQLKSPLSVRGVGELLLRPHTFVQHQRIHSDEKLYGCWACGHPSDLSLHQRLPASVKHYACKDCTRTFRQQSKLILHPRTHPDEKPHVCEDRGKASFVVPCLLYIGESTLGLGPISVKTAERPSANTPAHRTPANLHWREALRM